MAALGGLYVIGTNRHESRRVDLQLRAAPDGRAIRASRASSSASRTICSCATASTALIPAASCPAIATSRSTIRSCAREVARAQRIIEGQNFEIRQTLGRYAAVHRGAAPPASWSGAQAMLHGEEVPDVWARAPERRPRWSRAAGEDAVRDAERAVTLA